MGSIVVMGVSGCGKSTVGARLADKLGWPMIEGDDFHSPANVAKMRAGTPLTDADRDGWLDTLGAELQRHPAGAVLTCSALRKSYRDRLRGASPGLRFLHLALTRDEAIRRVSERTLKGADAHYFHANLVDSQFETLESPANEEGVLTVDATLPVDVVVQQALQWANAG